MMTDLDQYSTYTADDFILDEDFREIVRTSGLDNRLEKLLADLPEKKYEIKLSIRILNELHSENFTQSEDRKKELWQQIKRQHTKSIRLLVFKYAASLLFIIGISSVVFYFVDRNTIENVVVSEVRSTNDAILILADGKKVPISTKHSTIQYSTDGSGILVNDTAGITQTDSKDAVNQLIVPFGKRSYIVLSDETKVWLNSGSKLTFPPVFRGKTREVILEGEAFFDVTKNIEKPFFVRTDLFKMKVYGTKFNVQAYAQEDNNTIVLVEGKVSMNANKGLSPEVFLAPNQKATILEGEEKFEINHVENTEFYTAWIDGYLTFTNEDVRDVLKRVSRYYNVTIEAQLPTKVENIYGKLDLKEDLNRVLDGIAFVSKTKYEKQGNRYVFINNE